MGRKRRKHLFGALIAPGYVIRDWEKGPGGRSGPGPKMAFAIAEDRCVYQVICGVSWGMEEHAFIYSLIHLLIHSTGIIE